MPIEVVQDVAKRCQTGQLKPWEQKIKDDKGLTCQQLGEAVASIVEQKIKKSSQLSLPLVVLENITDEDFKEYANLKSIDRVEVMATGVWKGDPYTEQDLDNMIEAFNTLSFKPRLKLGHGSQKIADGMPALGYVSKLWREGKKLVASFIDIPQKLYELIKNKAYNAVSSEIWFNRKFEGKQWPRVLTGIALLGDQIPAVETLKDISAMYSLPGEGGELKVYTPEDYEAEIGKGKGVGNEPQGAGGRDECICPKCGHIQNHDRGTPCTQIKCEKCGAMMIGKEENKMAMLSISEIRKLSPAYAEKLETEGKKEASIDNVRAFIKKWEESQKKHDKEEDMTEEQKRELEDLKAKNAELTKNLEEKEKETESFKVELTKKDEETRKEKREAWIEKYSTGDNPKIAPVEKPVVTYLMEYFDSNGNDDVKKLSLDKEDLTPQQAFQKLFEKRAGLSGLFREFSKGGATQRGEGPLTLDEEMEIYQAENPDKTAEETIAYLEKTKPELFKDYERKE